MLHKSIPIKYAEVESESKTADHAVIGLPHREVVNVIHWQLFACHLRAVLLVLYVLFQSQVELSFRLLILAA